MIWIFNGLDEKRENSKSIQFHAIWFPIQVVRGTERKGAGGHASLPVFERSVNDTYSNRGGQIIPTTLILPPPPFLDLPSPLVLNKFRAIWGTNRVSDNKGQMRHCLWSKFKDTEKINHRNFGYIRISRNNLLLDKYLSFLYDFKRTKKCTLVIYITLLVSLLQNPEHLMFQTKL